MSAVCFSLRALLRSTLLFIVFGSLPLAHAQTRALTYAGVNLSGAEFASSKSPESSTRTICTQRPAITPISPVSA